MDPSKIIGEQKEHTVALTNSQLASSPHPSRGGGSLILESPPGPQRSGTGVAEDPAQRVGGSRALAPEDETAPRNDAVAATEPVPPSARADGATEPAMAAELVKRMDILRSMNADLRQQLEQFTAVGRPAGVKRQEEKRS